MATTAAAAVLKLMLLLLLLLLLLLRSIHPLAAYSLPRGRRGSRRVELDSPVPRPLPERASLSHRKPRPPPPPPAPPPPCSPPPLGRAELRRPWGPRTSLPPREGRTEASRAPLFPSHSGHSSDRWSSDPGDAPRA